MHPLSEDVTTEDGKVLSSPAVTSVYYFSKILFCYMWPFFLFNFYIVNSLTSCYFSGWKRDLLLFWLNCGARRGSAPRTAPGAEGAATLEHPPNPTPLFPAPAGQGRTKTSIEARVCSLAFPLAPRPWCGTATWTVYLNGFQIIYLVLVKFLNSPFHPILLFGLILPFVTVPRQGSYAGVLKVRRRTPDCKEKGRRQGQIKCVCGGVLFTTSLQS